MKKYIPLFGIGLHTVCFVFAVLSLGDYEYAGYGVGRAFAFWIYSMLIAVPCIAVYFVDAILSLKDKKSAIGIAKLIFLILAVLIFLFIGARAELLCFAIWNIFFMGLFIFEIISFILQMTKE